MTDMERENEELKRKLELITKLQESNHLRGQPAAPQSDDASDKVDSAWSNAQLYQSDEGASARKDGIINETSRRSSQVNFDCSASDKNATSAANPQ